VTRAEFLRTYHALDAIAVEALWHVYLTTRPERANIVAALDRLAAQHDIDVFVGPR